MVEPRLSACLLLGFTAATVAAGCVAADKDAAAAGPGWIRLAAGAVYPITIADACPGGCRFVSRARAGN
jgi:hypothetical protein